MILKHQLSSLYWVLKFQINWQKKLHKKVVSYKVKRLQKINLLWEPVLIMLKLREKKKEIFSSSGKNKWYRKCDL